MSNKYVSLPGLSRFLNRLLAIFAKTSDLDVYVKKINNPFRVGTGVSSACQKNASSSNTSSGESSIALGLGTTASGPASTSSGKFTKASGSGSHSEGNGSGNMQDGSGRAYQGATGENSHTEGTRTDAAGHSSHAEGFETQATKNRAHAEGLYTIAEGLNSHAEGQKTRASGDNSHAGGRYTVANNLAEFAAGSYNASKKASTAFGNAGNTHFSLGIGTSNEGRKNAIEVMQNGDLYVIGLGGTNAGSSGVKSFQTYINTLIGDALDEYYPQS